MVVMCENSQKATQSMDHLYPAVTLGISTNFLCLFDSCLYMVNLGLWPFFLEVAKKSGNTGLPESKSIFCIDFKIFL